MELGITTSTILLTSLYVSTSILDNADLSTYVSLRFSTTRLSTIVAVRICSPDRCVWNSRWYQDVGREYGFVCTPGRAGELSKVK